MSDKEKQQAFLKLYEPAHERLLRFAASMTRNREDARDLASETILRAYESFEKVRAPAAFLSYLFTIASRLHKRKIWRKRIFGDYDSDTAEQIPDNNLKPEIFTDVGFLYKAMSLLPNKQREALSLYEISGLTLDEIRKIQGGTISGVKSRLKRGRQRLAEILNEEHTSCKEVENYLYYDFELDAIKTGSSVIL